MKPRDNYERTYWYQLRIGPFDDGWVRDGLRIHTRGKKTNRRMYHKAMRRYDKRIIEKEKNYENI